MSDELSTLRRENFMLRRDKEAAETLMRLKDKAWNDLHKRLSDLEGLVAVLMDFRSAQIAISADRWRTDLRHDNELRAIRVRLTKLEQAVESWEETFAILSDPDLIAAIRASEQEIAEGRTVSLEDVMRECGIKPAAKGEDDVS